MTFYQMPNPYFKATGQWYKATPVGENSIGKFLKKICKNSGLNTTYTNHYLRGTAATAMHKSWYSLHEIAQVTRHKNLESLKHYLAKPTIDDMENYSNSFFQYTSNDNNKNSDNDFEMAPIPTKNVYKTVEKSKKNKTSDKQLVPFTATIDGNSNNNNNSQVSLQPAPPTTTSNIMALYHQNPVGMFVGANLNNCTININMPN